MGNNNTWETDNYKNRFIHPHVHKHMHGNTSSKKSKDHCLYQTPPDTGVLTLPGDPIRKPSLCSQQPEDKNSPRRRKQRE
jgi:hypothetical protein